MSQYYTLIKNQVIDFLGVFQIPGHKGGALQDDLALGHGGQKLRRAGLHDGIDRVGEGQTDAPLPIVVFRGEAAGGDALREAVALPDLDVGLMGL